MTDTAEIDRLRAIAADYQALQQRANQIDDMNWRLCDEIARLRAALRPLADIRLYRDPFPDAESDWLFPESLTAEDVRRARKALGRQP